MNLSADVLAKIGVSQSTQLQLPAQTPLLLKRTEVAALLDVSHVTVMRWERQGRIKAVAKTRQGGGLFQWSDLRTVLREAITRGLFDPFHSRIKMGPRSSVPTR